ncbi:MAG: hypothetical protein GY705_30590 [Bacteroidetes bacterium]|nr:hypothetical protein [Bacteroidota bacterium]
MRNLLIFLLLYSPILSFSQLTGYWQTDVGGCYQIRQSNNEVWWAGERADVQRPTNVFHGTIAGNTLTGQWCDLPSNSSQGCEQTLALRIESNNRMVKIASSSTYNGNVWTKQVGPCKKKNEYWEVKGSGGWTGIWTRQDNSDTYSNANFKAEWTNGSQTVTTTLSIKIVGNQMTGRRLTSSDGVICNYSGQVSNDMHNISGSGSCMGGSTFSWSAKIYK